MDEEREIHAIESEPRGCNSKLRFTIDDTLELFRLVNRKKPCEQAHGSVGKCWKEIAAALNDATGLQFTKRACQDKVEKLIG